MVEALAQWIAAEYDNKYDAHHNCSTYEN